MFYAEVNKKKRKKKGGGGGAEGGERRTEKKRYILINLTRNDKNRLNHLMSVASSVIEQKRILLS